MLCLKRVGGLSLIMLAARIASAADSRPAEELARLTKEATAASEELDRQPRATESERNEAYGRYRKQLAALTHRFLALAEAYPDAPEAPEALVWIVKFSQSRTNAARDTAYDLLAEHYLDKETLLPFVRTAFGWLVVESSPHSEAFLRAAVERSPNLKVKGLACLSLGRHLQYLARLQQMFDDPLRGKEVESRVGPEIVTRIRALDSAELRREAEELYERTIKEFADLRPFGKQLPPLGEQAEGALFRLRNLGIGCTAPEIDGEDIDGKPMKLSDFRGKVVVLSFWATWCGPCMVMVPEEKAMVERMKGRPFVLIGVNGDDDRARAKAVAAEKGINWRSFWDGGSQEGIPVKWGVTQWPTIYLIDAQGFIRDANLNSDDLKRATEALVAEAEAAPKTP